MHRSFSEHDHVSYTPARVAVLEIHMWYCKRCRLQNKSIYEANDAISFLINKDEMAIRLM